MRFFKLVLLFYVKCFKSIVFLLDVGKVIYFLMNCKLLSSFWFGLLNRGLYVFRFVIEIKLKFDLDF